MIVGATDATDATILAASSTLYRDQRLRRVYYSAFSPIPDAPSMSAEQVRRRWCARTASTRPTG
jgi:predicted DNA-binding helix-hairpin-helix protein